MRPVAAACLGAALSGLAEAGIAAADLDANLRTTSVAARNYDQPLLWGRDNGADGRTDLALRFIASGRPHQRLRWEAHAVQNLSLTTFASAATGSGNLLGTGGAEVPYRLAGTRWERGDAGDVRASGHLDRAHLRIALERADITAGRQAITFGKAWFWNPLDIFLPFGSTQFDRDYKPGVDALRVDLPLGDFSGATLVAAPGRAQSGAQPAGGGDAWYRSALVARAYGNARGWDVAAQGGKILGGYQLGGAVTGELGEPAAARGSGMVRRAGRDRGRGFGRFSGWRPPRRGRRRRPRFRRPRPPAAGRVLLQRRRARRPEGTVRPGSRWPSEAREPPPSRRALTSGRIHPLVSGSLAGLWGIGDGSWLAQPGLVWSAANEVEVVAGAVIARGRRPVGGTAEDLRFRSEFGTYPDFYYLETKLYF